MVGPRAVASRPLPSPAPPPLGGANAWRPRSRELNRRRDPDREQGVDPWTACRSSTPPCETASSRSLNPSEKLEIAHQLARLGVDVIEAGFPITSPGDFEAVQAISRQ